MNDMPGQPAGGPAPAPPPIPPARSLHDRFPFPTFVEGPLMLVALFVLMTLAFVVSGILLGILSFSFSGLREQVLTAARSLPGMVLLTIALFSPLLAWGWWRTRRGFCETFWLRRVSVLALLAMLPLSVGASICLKEVLNFLHSIMPLPNFIKDIFDKLMSQPLEGVIIFGLLAPLLEEPFFRAQMLGGLARRGWRWTAIVYTAFLFALFHMNPVQFPVAFLMGLILGWIMLRTRSLWPCLFLHAFYNLTPVILKNSPIPEIQGYNSEPAAGVYQPLWFDAIGVTCFVIGIVALLAATQTGGEQEECVREEKPPG